MGYRANPTDKGQNELEQATFEGGIPVQEDGKQRVVAKALHTAPYKTAHITAVGAADGAQRNNAGVVMPPADKPGRFETPGKA